MRLVPAAARWPMVAEQGIQPAPGVAELSGPPLCTRHAILTTWQACRASPAPMQPRLPMRPCPSVYTFMTRALCLTSVLLSSPAPPHSIAVHKLCALMLVFNPLPNR